MAVGKNIVLMVATALAGYDEPRARRPVDEPFTCC